MATYPRNPQGFGPKTFRCVLPLVTIWGSDQHRVIIPHSWQHPQISPNPHLMGCTQCISHVASERQPCVATPPRYSSCRVKVPSPSFELFVSVSSFPITSWVGGDKGRQSVCRTGWLCLPRGPANRGCRLLMEHSGFRRCQLQIERPSGKQIQVPGGRSDSPLIC